MTRLLAVVILALALAGCEPQGRARVVKAAPQVGPGDLLLAPTHCDEIVTPPVGWVKVDCALYVHKFAKGDPRQWTFYERRIATP